MRVRLLGLMAVLTVVAGACGGAEAAPEPAGDGALASGIGVHGAWTIEVLNPDGTAAANYEFTNALTQSGEEILADVVLGSHYVSAIAPRIVVSGSELDPNAPSPCGTTSDPLLPCIIATSDTAYSQPTPDVLEVTGSFVAAQDGGILQVETELPMCRVGVEPCVATWTDFTAFVFVAETGADDPIPVSAGQTVQVTVELSFGTLR